MLPVFRIAADGSLAGSVLVVVHAPWSSNLPSLCPLTAPIGSRVRGREPLEDRDNRLDILYPEGDSKGIRP